MPKGSSRDSRAIGCPVRRGGTGCCSHPPRLRGRGKPAFTLKLCEAGRRDFAAAIAGSPERPCRAIIQRTCVIGNGRTLGGTSFSECPSCVKGHLFGRKCPARRRRGGRRWRLLGQQCRRCCARDSQRGNEASAIKRCGRLHNHLVRCTEYHHPLKPDNKIPASNAASTRRWTLQNPVLRPRGGGTLKKDQENRPF
jgi:hypothetical protein